MSDLHGTLLELALDLRETRRRVDDLEKGPNTLVTVSVDDVANPPTDAQLDSAFGTPAAVGSGFVGLVDDNDADANVWLVASNATSWWYVALTKAV